MIGRIESIRSMRESICAVEEEPQLIACVPEIDTRTHERRVSNVIGWLGVPDLANIRQIESATVNCLQRHNIAVVGGTVRGSCDAEYVAKGCRPIDNL